MSSFKLADPQLHYIHPGITSYSMYCFAFCPLPCPAELEDNSQIVAGKERDHGKVIIPLPCKDCLKRMVENKLNGTVRGISNWNMLHCCKCIYLLCLCSKGCLILSSSPKSLHSNGHWIHELVLYVRKQVQTKCSQGQRSTQRLFHSWLKSLWLTLVWCSYLALSIESLTIWNTEDSLVCFPPVFLEVSVRAVFCNCLLLHGRKGDVRDAWHLSVQAIPGIAELLGEAQISYCPPRGWICPPLLQHDFPLPEETSPFSQNMRHFFFSPTRS